MMNHSGQKQRSPKDPSRFFFPLLAKNKAFQNAIGTPPWGYHSFSMRSTP